MLLFLYFFLDKFFIHSLLVTLKLVTFKWHFDFQILAIINSRDLLFKSGTKNFTIYVTYSSFKVSYYHYCDYHSIVIFTFIIIKCIIIIVTNYFIVAIVIITDTCLAIISLNFLSIFLLSFSYRDTRQLWTNSILVSWNELHHFYSAFMWDCWKPGLKPSWNFAMVLRRPYPP